MCVWSGVSSAFLAWTSLGFKGDYGLSLENKHGLPQILWDTISECSRSSEAVSLDPPWIPGAPHRKLSKLCPEGGTQAGEQGGDTSPAGPPLTKLGAGKQLYLKTEKDAFSYFTSLKKTHFQNPRIDVLRASPAYYSWSQQLVQSVHVVASFSVDSSLGSQPTQAPYCRYTVPLGCIR